MHIKSNIIKAAFVLMIGTMMSCAIPIATSTKYPIDVFYLNDPIDRPYTEIGFLEIGSEDSLTKQQTGDNRMIMRGNDARTKELLMAKLVLKAQKIGADALIEVKYKYYTSVNEEGYMLSGYAIRYRGD